MASSSGTPPYAVEALALEPKWSDELVCLLLGAEQAEDDPRPGRARVTRSLDRTSAVVEFAALDDARGALVRDGLEVPLTHGYRHCRLRPLPPNDHLVSLAHDPDAEPPLEMQLAPLTTAELTRRIDRLDRLRGRPPTRPDAARPSTPPDDPSPSPSPSPAAKRRKRDPKTCKVTRHLRLCRHLARALGGERPSRRVLGAPLPRDDASLARRDALLATLRAFQHWPEPSDARRGVTAGKYMTLKRRDVEARRRETTANPNATTAEEDPRRRREDARADLWRLAEATLASVDPDAGFDAIAVTEGFRGSPHVDAKDVSHQHVLALGDFRGGELCVEASSGRGRVETTREDEQTDDSDGTESGARTIRVDVRERVARVDGRQPHWVSGWEGERFSLVFFSTRDASRREIAPTSVHEAWMRDKRVAAGEAEET